MGCRVHAAAGGGVRVQGLRQGIACMAGTSTQAGCGEVKRRAAGGGVPWRGEHRPGSTQGARQAHDGRNTKRVHALHGHLALGQALVHRAGVGQRHTSTAAERLPAAVQTSGRECVHSSVASGSASGAG